MKTSLQYLFIESKGNPVNIPKIGNVYQLDKVLVNFTKLRVTFLEGNSPLVCGVNLKLENGYFNLSSNRKVNHLKIWNELDTPRYLIYDIIKKNNLTVILKVWNTYRIHHKSGLITEDQFTNNSCMFIEIAEPNRKIYHCSDGMYSIDINNQVFQLEFLE